MIISITGVSEYETLKIPSLKLGAGDKEIEIINICNTYIQTTKDFELRNNKKVYLTYDKDMKQCLLELINLLGYNEEVSIDFNRLLLDEFIACCGCYYRKNKILTYLYWENESLVFASCCKDSILEIIPVWSYLGIYAEVRGYGDAVNLAHDKEGKQLSYFEVNKIYNYNLKVNLKDGHYQLDEECFNYIKNNNGGFHLVDLGDCQLVFSIGTDHYTIPMHKWFMMLLKDNKVVSRITLPHGGAICG
ncbi:hypothetical protein [uncultured Clostridium sp.]|uniref:hypothetical protein n=1 Tax=uncultured Clostridium sp. TaxID=59620 RepID=UPI0026F3CD64|nr:hypothetical protein [uncultured Clostridium sp.]